MKVNFKDLNKILEMLERGEGVEVILRNECKILRIEWFNLLYFPSIVSALGSFLANFIEELKLYPDAISSIETSGSKFGLVASLYLNVPFFPIQKNEKITFKLPVSISSRSVTQEKTVNLFVDREIVKKFKRIILIDDIRRTSGTLSSAVHLIEYCGSKVVACFSILDFKFSSGKVPETIEGCKYYPLIIISEISEDGKCKIEDGFLVNYLKLHKIH